MRKKTNWILAGFYFVVLMLVSACLNRSDYWYDAGWYWRIGGSTIADGHFRLTDFPATYRGFYLPVIITALQHLIGHGSWAWRLFINGLVAIEFAIILPALFDDAIDNKSKMIRSSISLLVFVWLWGDYIQYPLADFVAFFFFTIAVIIAKKLAGTGRALLRIHYGMMCGLFLYLAYNTRVSYLWGGVVLMGVVFFSANKKEKLIVSMLAVTIGALITAFPQMIINENNEGSFTPRIYTENYSNSQNLELQQVLWGISYPRYETCINFEEYSNPKMFFEDPVGMELINRHNVDTTTLRLKQYLSMWIKNPIDMLAIYTRHFISAATPIFTTCYVTDLREDRTLILFSIIMLWFFTVVSIVEKLKTGDRHGMGWIFAIVLPSFMQIVGAIETRFFLPIYVLVIYHACTVIDFKELYSKTKTKRLELALLFVIVMLLWTTVYSDLLAMNVETVFLIND